MKFLVLNLPYQSKIIRKYSCSYFARGFLYPPVELVRLSTIIEENSFPGDEVLFYDAIVENHDEDNCIEKIKNIQPDYIFTMTSIDFISSELKFIEKLRLCVKNPLIIIGYIPSLYPDDFSKYGVVLDGNFETIVYNSLLIIKAEQKADFIEIIKNERLKRTEHNPDLIVHYNLKFIKNYRYKELFSKGNTGFTYWSFGCPYSCSFCIKTYNQHKVSFRKTENILQEIKYFAENGIKNIRLLDDNCTLKKTLLKEVLKFQSENGLKFNYYGLTRIDLLDNEVVDLLIDLNFKHIMIGLETINENSGREYNKIFNIDFEQTKLILKKLRKNKVEISIFMLFNPLTEQFTDIKNTLSYLRNLPVSFASLSYVIPYPGTDIFKKNEQNIEVQNYPEFRWRWKKDYYLNLKKNETYFLKNFYFTNPDRFINLIRLFLKYPSQAFDIFFDSMKYLFTSNKEREDYF
ncbi:MAG: radical SAM protein [Bacteroidales bacterium]|jgi:radical SAM superfamily enzyme YgiQ (UPF0313 family)|nr:radical SAM protein [Bacteroidales bacterium]HOL98626.1 radical SAM protein [Bacteroidales bacterium]HOM37010.1 radical SAM protein [Bacteroidales bacterium]HPD24104.1 radical SAM protein [Bacteroidales bacterium]HRS99322.1 radical SAM protein [Bacteroidales bacterium]